MDVASELISSRSNKVIKYLKTLGLARNRQKEGRFLIEGVRMVEEALEREGCVEKVLVTPQATTGERAAAIIFDAREKGIEVLWVADRVVEYISETKSSQGVMALVKPVRFTEGDLAKGQIPLIVLAHLLQDPGNIGTIIRTAEAAGAGGVVTTPDTVDFYNPKALRASMGSIFRLPTVKTDSIEGFVGRFKRKGWQVAAAMVSARTKHFDADFTKPTILLLGQEGAGLPPDAVALTDFHISIPMATMIDSLNVATATGVILFEAVRQSQFRKS